MQIESLGISQKLALQEKNKNSLQKQNNLNNLSYSPNLGLYSLGHSKEIGFKASQSLRSNMLSLPSFGSGGNKTYSKISSNQITLNIFEVPEELSINDEKTILSKGITFTRGGDATHKAVFASDGEKNEVFTAFCTKGRKIPPIQYRKGKFDHRLEIIDKDLGIKVMLMPGSHVESDKFELKMPGEIQLPLSQKTLSFSGNKEEDYKPKEGVVNLVTYNLEPRTQATAQRFCDANLHSLSSEGTYKNTFSVHKPTSIVLVGGNGERFKDFTGEDDTKPTYNLPGEMQYPMLGNALSLCAQAGALNHYNDFIFISQKGSISGDNVIRVNQHRGHANLEDGGGTAEAIKLGKIRNDKDLIILNADTFTNADITRAYHSLKTLPDAALVIPYVPAPGKRVLNSFGLISTNEDDEGNLKIDSFVEKPKNPDELKIGNTKVADEEDMYKANPGIYLMSKEVVKLLGDQADLDKGKSVKLGAEFVPMIVKMCKEGKLKNENGEPMKVYTVPLLRADGKTAYWDDLGTGEAYHKLALEINADQQKNGNTVESRFYGLPQALLEDISNQTDPETGIVYQNSDAKEKFELFTKKHDIKEAKGRIFVSKL